jgi:type 1 glutamine amidotransferase
MTARSLLVFHRAVGFVHRSIPDAVEALRSVGRDHGVAVEATDDPDRLTGDLAHDALVFVHTSGDVLPEEAQRRGLERYVTGGGGFVAVHAAASMGPDVERDWPWYRDLVGASFKGHTIARVFCAEPVDERPGVTYGGPVENAPADADRWGEARAMWSCEEAIVRVEDPDCPVVAGIRDGERMTDEWYGFHDNPRPRVNVAATVDESSYDAHLGAMGPDHPIVWWHDHEGGRSVYNSMGHSAATWSDPRFLASIRGGIAFAARWDTR